MQKKKTRRFLFFTGILITLAISVFCAVLPGGIERFSHRVLDAFMGLLPAAPPPGDLVLVDVDEKSLAQAGQWPWPRYRLAELISAIGDMGASAIGLDMLFPEPDRTSLEMIRREIERDVGMRLRQFPEVPALDNDNALAEAVQDRPVILGIQYFMSRPENIGLDCLPEPDPVTWVATGTSLSVEKLLLTPAGILCSIPVIQSAGRAGFINTTAESDGAIRRLPLLISYRGRVYPSLALGLVMQGMGLKQGVLKAEGGRPASLVVGGKTIPTDAMGRILLRDHNLTNRYPRISAVDVLQGRTDPNLFKNRMVLVGTTAVGLHDEATTALNPRIPGVIIHAAVAENLITGDTLSRPFWASGLEICLLLAMGIFSSLLLASMGSLAGGVVLVLAASLLWGGAAAVFINARIFLSPLWPSLVLLVNYILLTLIKYRKEERALIERTRELAKVQGSIIDLMAAVIETRDDDTGGHIFRTKEYIKILADHLKDHPRFSDYLDEETIQFLHLTAPLHDVGKVGVPDRVLLKPGRLNDEEFTVMKGHVRHGQAILKNAREKLKDSRFLEVAEELARTHQEKWDGSGYPAGLCGEDIPVSGRLMALADVYDALISRRVYKPGMSHETAVSIIAKGKGTHFDPDVADAFLELKNTFLEIALRFTLFKEDKDRLLGKDSAKPQT